MPPRRYNRIADDDRQRIIECFNNGQDFLTLAATLGVKRTTTYSIVRRYNQNGYVLRRPNAGGRRVLLDHEAVDFLIMLIEANPCYTLNEMNNQLRDIFPRQPRVSTMTLSRHLKNELITMKQARNIPQNRNSLEVKEQRVAYANWMFEEGIQKHRIYIDETGFNLYTKRAYGRAPIGERVNRVVSGQRGGNVTVITAISDQVGVLYYEVHLGSVKAETFNEFMASMEAIIEDEDVVILMDNAPCHRGILEVYPELQLKYLPPHSPFLNPIEECFSVFKAYLKQYLNDITNAVNAPAAARAGVNQQHLRQGLLQQAVHATLRTSVTREVVAANYRHSNSYLATCLRQEDIWH